LFYIADSQQKWEISKGHVQTIRCLPQQCGLCLRWHYSALAACFAHTQWQCSCLI